MPCEILVPARTGLSLKANNGGIFVAGVESAIEFHAVNEGIHLKNMGGNVRGDNVNGGSRVNLAASRWDGQGLDVSTKNGGVSMQVPDQFSALPDVENVNGGLNMTLPHVSGRSSHKLNLRLGSGGPPSAFARGTAASA